MGSVKLRRDSAFNRLWQLARYAWPLEIRVKWKCRSLVDIRDTAKVLNHQAKCDYCGDIFYVHYTAGCRYEEGLWVCGTCPTKNDRRWDAFCRGEL